jgi:hypothetical protein
MLLGTAEEAKEIDRAVEKLWDTEDVEEKQAGEAVS